MLRSNLPKSLAAFSVNAGERFRALGTISAIDVWPVDVPLVDPFVISRGAVTRAEVAFVRVRLDSGVVGYGEIAPFHALTGETRDASVLSARRMAGHLAGRSADDSQIAAFLQSLAPTEPSACAGIECALVDAVARACGAPLWQHWGAAEVVAVETDITLPILEAARVAELAASWHARGFRTFKLKVGGDRAADRERVSDIAARYSDVCFILDANQGFSGVDAATEFIDSLGEVATRIRLLEQPLARGDLSGMAELRKRLEIPLAADESVFTASDARNVVDAGAADVINLKIMKSGLHETFAIASIAREHDVGLMIGGMVETRLAMSFSLAFVMGVGGVTYVDLDTPLLLAEDPVRGGFAYDGPRMTVWNEFGTGIEPVRPPE